MNSEIRKNIANEENLANVTGGSFPDSILFEEVCPYCGKTFNRCDGNEISGKLYCPECWENKEKLGIPGIYEVENGVAGGW